MAVSLCRGNLEFWGTRSVGIGNFVLLSLEMAGRYGVLFGKGHYVALPAEGTSLFMVLVFSVKKKQTSFSRKKVGKEVKKITEEEKT